MSKKPIELPCQKVVELVNDYLGHALTSEDREAFQLHLETCPPCTTYLEQMQTVLNLARSLGTASMRAEVEPQLLAIFEHWQGKSTS
ncbi:MAG TPA: zf-HC2 domain-containing protein [Polyangiaceae bacterium]|nr:zf-HC2 domain-containing protein [Polyangiaceae bacterium]